jgi:hypothetical protein
MEAFGTTAPVESVTVPLIPPRKVWANAGTVRVQKRKRLRIFVMERFMQYHLTK